MSGQPLTLQLKTTLIFIGIATAIILGIAGLEQFGVLEINLELEGVTPLGERYWHQFVALSGLVVPLVILIIKRRDGLVRAVLSPYLGVLAIQIVTEVLFLPGWGKRMSVIIGIIYSVFRLAQLGQGQQLVRSKQKASSRLRLFLLFLLSIWTINLLRLLFWHGLNLLASA
jgi:hypothetical protein